MQQVPNTSTVIQAAKICQYLYNRDISANRFYNGKPLDSRRPLLLYITRKDVEYLYGVNPSDSRLFQITSYLFGLCAPFIQQALQIIANAVIAGPVLNGPLNQSVNVGNNATFSVLVTGAAPFSYQWYDYNGVAIPGANSSNYTLINAQLSDSGHTFFVRVTDANGKTATSNVVTLTVTAIITGFFSYQSADPAATLQASSDPFTYQESFSITNGQPWVMNVPSASTPNMYIIVKGPIGQPIKTAWNNGGVNTGFIPDLNWHPTLAFGGFQYYYTRLFSLDPLQTLTLS